eukprot:10745299-Alexandrium_andersonii.AAC.1
MPYRVGRWCVLHQIGSTGLCRCPNALPGWQVLLSAGIACSPVALHECHESRAYTRPVLHPGDVRFQ